MESISSSEDRQEVVTSSVSVRPLTQVLKSAAVGVV